MSKQIQGTTQITNKEILKKTLTEMGHSFKEVGNTISWGSGYRSASINLDTKKMSFDDMYGKTLNGVLQNYSKNLIKAEIMKKGHKVKSVKTLKTGQIEIVASY